MHKYDVLALLSVLVGVGSLSADTAFGTQLNALFGSHDATIALSALGLLGIVASQILRVLGSPSTTKGTS